MDLCSYRIISQLFHAQIILLKRETDASLIGLLNEVHFLFSQQNENGPVIYWAFLITNLRS